jgi:uncharacterized membrane protein HdeD (DUF308 family)
MGLTSRTTLGGKKADMTMDLIQSAYRRACWALLSLAFAVSWMALWLLVTGTFAISDAMAERWLGAPWGWTLAFGILAIATGALAVLTPPATLAVLMAVIAGFGLVGGILHLIGAYRLAWFKREVSRVTAAATAH